MAKTKYKVLHMNGINYRFAENIDVNITIDEDNNTTIMTTRDQSAEWIFNTLYGNADIPFEHSVALKKEVKNLVNKWEDILAKEGLK